MCRRAARLHGHGIPSSLEAAAAQRECLERRRIQVTGYGPAREDCDAEIRLDHFDNGLGEIHPGDPSGGNAGGMKELLVNTELPNRHRVGDEVLCYKILGTQTAAPRQAMLGTENRNHLVFEERAAGDRRSNGRVGNYGEIELSGEQGVTVQVVKSVAGAEKEQERENDGSRLLQ